MYDPPFKDSHLQTVLQQKQPSLRSSVAVRKIQENSDMVADCQTVTKFFPSRKKIIPVTFLFSSLHHVTFPKHQLNKVNGEGKGKVVRVLYF